MLVRSSTLSVVLLISVAQGCDAQTSHSASQPETSDDRRSIQLTKDLDRAFACYGDTIDVLFAADENEVILNIPIEIRAPLYPLLEDETQSNELSAWRRQCHDEPVPVRQFAYVFNHTPNESLGFEDGFVVHRIIIEPYRERLPDFMSEFPRGFGLKRKENLSDSRHGNELQSTKFGFLHEGPADQVGFYLWPGDYRFPNEDKFALRCSPGIADGNECRVSYQLARHVAITYWFRDKYVPQSNWIELDRRVRAFALQLLEKPQPL